MRVYEWLQTAEEKIARAGIATSKLDVQILLADELSKDRSWLLAHSEHELTTTQIAKLDKKVERRAKHEPIAYIRGKQEFYGREFFVSPDTLTPRPETETMLELLFEQMGDRGLEIGDELQIVDVGTGSGCIAITAALELSKLPDLSSKISYIGLDISEPALEIARKNAEKFSVDVEFKKFDLLNDDLTSISDLQSSIYLCNLPYVPEDFQINTAATHEPDFAIFGGKDGLDYYRELFTQLMTGDRRSEIEESYIVLTESLPPQHEKLSEIAEKAGFTLVKSQDLIQVFLNISSIL